MVQILKSVPPVQTMGRRPTTPAALVLALTAYLTIETAGAYSPTHNTPHTLRRHHTHHSHTRDATSTRHIPPVLAKAVEVADADAAAPSSASPSIADGEWLTVAESDDSGDESGDSESDEEEEEIEASDSEEEECCPVRK